ncbi:MAG: hypothetical protein QOF97_1537 [Acidimicrobiaceae bacterium]
MDLKPGTRLKSAVCDTEVIVVRAPTEPVELECGGQTMVAQTDAAPAGLSLDADHSAGTPVGKRYAHVASGLVILATKAGAGSLSVAGEPLPLKDAKPLPSSD